MAKVTKTSLHASIDDLFETNREMADALGLILSNLTSSDTAVSVKATSRRGRKPVVEDDLDDLDAPKTTRRGRRPVVETEEPTRTRRGRKPVVEDDLAELDDDGDDDTTMEFDELTELSDKAIIAFLEQFDEVTIDEKFDGAGIRELNAYFKEMGMSTVGFEGKRSERAEAMAAVATTAELAVKEIMQFDLDDIVNAINELIGDTDEEYVVPARGREKVKLENAARELFRLAVEQEN